MISVCMAYHERRDQLLKSIRAYGDLYEHIEISVVDDGSHPSLVLPESRHPINFYRIDREPGALNPCVPMNEAVNQSSGDFIVLTNPEVFHVKPVLGQMLDSLESDMHYVIAACKDHDGRWLAHSSTPETRKGRKSYPKGSDMHFCAMLSRKLWEKTGGFDERYREGGQCDDCDWLWTLENLGVKFVMRDDLVVHSQKHHREQWPPSAKNRELLEQKWGHKWNLSS